MGLVFKMSAMPAMFQAVQETRSDDTDPLGAVLGPGDATGGNFPGENLLGVVFIAQVYGEWGIKIKEGNLGLPEFLGVKEDETIRDLIEGINDFD
jgi:hypothetical protein